MLHSYDEGSRLLNYPALWAATIFDHDIPDCHGWLWDLITDDSIKRLAIAWPGGHAKCLHPDTLIQMRDGTRKKASEVLPGDELSLGICVASESNGIQPTIKITLRTGHEIVVTPNHPFKLESGEWKNAGDLEQGDEVVLGVGFKAWDELRTDIPYEAFYLMGLMTGDGALTHANCRFTCNEEVLVDAFRRCLDVMGFSEGKTSDQPGKTPMYSITGGGRKFFREVGMAGKGSYEKTVPDCVLKGSTEQIRHFLAGYLDTDGTYGHGRNGLSFTSVSKPLLQGVQSLLLRLGIVASLQERHGAYNGATHVSWMLRIPTAGYDEVRNWPIKCERKIPIRCESQVRYLPTVSKIEAQGKQETWAIQVDSGVHHTEDILTHNTTIISTEYPLWRVCKNPAYRMAMIQKGLSQGQDVLLDMQRTITGNDNFRRLYGDWKPPADLDGFPWSTSKMRVAHNASGNKTHNFHAFGSGSRDILGQRFDELVPDDVVTEENSNTPEARRKLETWESTTVDKTLMLSKYNLIRLIGTAFYHDDLLMRKRDIATCVIKPHEWPKPSDLTDKQKAGWVFVHKDAEVGMIDGCTLWVKEVPWERLEFEKTTDPIGVGNYRRRLRNIIENPATVVFKRVWIEGGTDPETNVKYPGCLDRNRIIGQYPDSEVAFRTICGADPSSGRETQTSGRFAHMTVAAREGDRNRYVIDLFTDALPAHNRNDYNGVSKDCETQIGTMIYRHMLYGALGTVLEVNSQQKTWAGTLKECAPETLRVIEHTTGRNKLDSEVGVEAMAGIFENGNVRLPYGDPESQRLVNQFIEQLTRYPDFTWTDLIMAFWFCNLHITKKYMPKVVPFRINKLHQMMNPDTDRRIQQQRKAV